MVLKDLFLDRQVDVWKNQLRVLQKRIALDAEGNLELSSNGICFADQIVKCRRDLF